MITNQPAIESVSQSVSPVSTAASQDIIIITSYRNPACPQTKAVDSELRQ